MQFSTVKALEKMAKARGACADRVPIMRRISSVLLVTLLHSTSFYASPPASVTVAARAGDREAVRQLLQHGADVNAAEADGMTAFHWAATKDDLDLVRMLLRAGANLRAMIRLGGYTPLMMAARNGNAAIIEALLNAGADVNAVTSFGTTVLMLVAASGRVAAVGQIF